LVVSNWLPAWFYASKGIGGRWPRTREKVMLLSGLDALA
jgi:hypothetical protein